MCPSCFKRWVFCFLAVPGWLLGYGLVYGQQDFVTRQQGSLWIGPRQFYFIGANAYYLMESAARGDTGTVAALFSRADELGMTVIRTWGFFDADDSLDPAAIQVRPGVYNEHALEALDYVVLRAKMSGIRLLIPLVNNWDDYGGMNQYVRWRDGMEEMQGRYTREQTEARVVGGRGQSYRVALSPALGHDDFYSDSLMKEWYKAYAKTIVERTNTLTGTQYKDEPAILGWELANEPRSSDRTGTLVNSWVKEMSVFLKSVDANHLVGTGEEGFEVSPAGYVFGPYGTDTWLFDGTAGVSFTENTKAPSIDIASIHIYPEAWSLPLAAGNPWIAEHLGRSSSFEKPLVIGEFGSMEFKAATYDSWLSTAYLENTAGALVWQLLDSSRSNNDGFGVRCPEESNVCSVLGNFALLFSQKSDWQIDPLPAPVLLHQNYPNPFNGQTTISYELPFDAYVRLLLFNAVGQCVLGLVNAHQRGGLRKELLDASLLPSGVYFYRLELTDPTTSAQHEVSRKLTLIK